MTNYELALLRFIEQGGTTIPKGEGLDEYLTRHPDEVPDDESSEDEDE